MELNGWLDKEPTHAHNDTFTGEVIGELLKLIESHYKLRGIKISE